MLPAELQVGRRAARPRPPAGVGKDREARPRAGPSDEMDGCSRQDPAYRPAKGRAPERGSFLFRPRGVPGRRSAGPWPGGSGAAGEPARRCAEPSAQRARHCVGAGGQPGARGPSDHTPPCAGGASG